MAIDFDCSGCGRTYRVDDALAGKRTKCKICDAILTVPAPKTARPASRPPLQTFGAPAAPSPRPAPAPAPRPKMNPEPEHSAAHLYGLDEADEVPVFARSSYDDEPEDEIQGPRRSARPGQTKGQGKASRREYAGVLRRFAASLIDGVILIVILVVCLFLSGMVLGFRAAGQGRAVTPDEIAVVVWYCYIGWAVFTYLYYAGMTSSSYQGTLGKLALGIKVCDLDGRPIGFGRALLRELAKFLSSIFLIGYIMAAFTEKTQALHDILLQTLVVKD